MGSGPRRCAGALAGCTRKPCVLQRRPRLLLGMVALTTCCCVPFLGSLRASQEEFLENLHKAADALQAVVPRVIQFIAGKRYSQL